MWLSLVLTWTLPLRAALVSVHQYGEAQQATVRRLRGKGAALRLVEEDELVVDAEILCAFVDNLCVRRLERKKCRWKPVGHQTTAQIHRNISTTETRFYWNPFAFFGLFALFLIDEGNQTGDCYQETCRKSKMDLQCTSLQGTQLWWLSPLLRVLF